MNLIDLALDTKDKEWFNYILILPDKIDKELESIADNFIAYFTEIAETEGLTVRQLVSDIKDDIYGLTDYEKSLYIDCNFKPQFKQKILALLNK